MKTKPATTAKDNPMWRFLRHNRSGIPAPDYTKASAQVVVLITDGNPPYSGIIMTEGSEIDAIRYVCRSRQAAEGRNDLPGLWTASRTRTDPQWVIQDWTGIRFYL